MPAKTRSAKPKSAIALKKAGLSPVPLGSFMAPPGARPAITRKPASKIGAKPANAGAKQPSKAAAAKDIESAAKALLKLSRSLKG
jgi:hypothetical protein